ncbi:hypothetical protein [uncultured Anaerococcus sp.]|uniref:hypothetical protein n=1 Tax=uncultured Anaerococcus sp. TaxID=293428 RepID=UPI00288AF00E|nr:hypothetical protein [uncultured Anaerococcus sp.]
MNKKLFKFTGLALGLMLSLTACSEKPKENTDDTSKIVQREEVADEKKEEKIEEEKNPSENNQKLAKLYNKVLDEIDTYEFSDVEYGKYTYSYALVKTDEADYPQLLVAQDTDFGLSYLKLFTVNDDFTDVFHDDELISIGVATAGGFRGIIAQNADYNALIYTTFMSGTGQGQEEKITSSIEDKSLKLKREVIWEGRIDTKAQDDSEEIDFSEIEDRDKLHDLANIKDVEYVKSLEENKEEKPEDINKEKVENPRENESKNQSQPGTMVATGVVRVFNHDEMIAYQKSNPKMLSDMGEHYTVLILDKTIDVTLPIIGGDGDMTKNVGLISLPEDMMSYKDKEITISFGPRDGYWQSDVSLPMEAPRMNQVKVLE